MTADEYDTVKLASVGSPSSVDVSSVSALVDISDLNSLTTLTTDTSSYVAMTAAQFASLKSANPSGTLKLTGALTEDSGSLTGAWKAAIELAAGTENNISITPDASGVYAITGDGSGDVVTITTTSSKAAVTSLNLTGVTFNLSGDANLTVSGSIHVDGSGDLAKNIEYTGSGVADFSGFSSDIVGLVDTTAVGTLIGGSGNDYLRGFANGASGSTIVCGEGADYIRGGGTVVTGALASGDTSSTAVANLKESLDENIESSNASNLFLNTIMKGGSDSHQVIMDAVYNEAFEKANIVGAWNDSRGTATTASTVNVVCSTGKDSVMLMSGNEGTSNYQTPATAVNLYKFNPTDDNIVLINHSADLTVESTTDVTPVALLKIGNGTAATSGWNADNSIYTLALTDASGALSTTGSGGVAVTWAGIGTALSTIAGTDNTDSALSALATGWTGAGDNSSSTDVETTTFTFASLNDGEVNLTGVCLEFYASGDFTRYSAED